VFSLLLSKLANIFVFVTCLWYKELYMFVILSDDMIPSFPRGFAGCVEAGTFVVTRRGEGRRALAEFARFSPGYVSVALTLRLALSGRFSDIERRFSFSATPTCYASFSSAQLICDRAFDVRFVRCDAVGPIFPLRKVFCNNNSLGSVAAYAHPVKSLMSF
jgi:hypothetical protein